jgi:hypothetical protein
MRFECHSSFGVDRLIILQFHIAPLFNMIKVLRIVNIPFLSS